ncbi:hypothetical protein BJY59DRAFT_241053 [Rhodotorula toruloides]
MKMWEGEETAEDGAGVLSGSMGSPKAQREPRRASLAGGVEVTDANSTLDISRRALPAEVAQDGSLASLKRYATSYVLLRSASTCKMGESPTDDALSLNKDASPSRQPSIDVTLQTLRQLYTTVARLAELVPDGFRLVKKDDSEGYQSLVGGMVVASTALVGPPELPTTVQNASVTMEEVLSTKFSSASLQLTPKSTSGTRLQAGWRGRLRRTSSRSATVSPHRTEGISPVAEATSDRLSRRFSRTPSPHRSSLLLNGHYSLLASVPTRSSTCSPPRQQPCSLLCRMPACCRSPALPSPSFGLWAAMLPRNLQRGVDGPLISGGSGDGGESLAKRHSLRNRLTTPRLAPPCRSTPFSTLPLPRRLLRNSLASKYQLRHHQ